MDGVADAGGDAMGGDDPDGVGLGGVGAEGAHEVCPCGQGAAGDCQRAIGIDLEVVAFRALRGKLRGIVIRRSAGAAAAHRFQCRGIGHTL